MQELIDRIAAEKMEELKRVSMDCCSNPKRTCVAPVCRGAAPLHTATEFTLGRRRYYQSTQLLDHRCCR